MPQRIEEILFRQVRVGNPPNQFDETNVLRCRPHDASLITPIPFQSSRMCGILVSVVSEAILNASGTSAFNTLWSRSQGVNAARGR